MSEEKHLTAETLLAVLVLIFYTISPSLFEKYHFHYAHESGICMIVGICISLIAHVVNPEVYIIFIIYDRKISPYH